MLKTPYVTDLTLTFYHFYLGCASVSFIAERAWNASLSESLSVLYNKTSEEISKAVSWYMVTDNSLQHFLAVVFWRVNAPTLNHNNFNFLKCDWWINCRILLQLICKVVIGQCDRRVGCNQTPVIGQLQEPIIVTNSRDWPCKIVEV